MPIKIKILSGYCVRLHAYVSIKAAYNGDKLVYCDCPGWQTCDTGICALIGNHK